MIITRGVALLTSLALALALALVVGCAKVQQSGVDAVDAGGSGGVRGTGALGGGTGTEPRGTAGTTGGPVGCKNLQCQQMTCPNGASTTVSGKVYDPAGKVPLYNVIVYVPNAPLAPIAEGVSCERCAGTASGSPVASALTDASGAFVLQNVPVGRDIPLVMQVGKWRREVTIPEVVACADTKFDDVNLTRLPRNQQEGHLPRMALATGHSDALDCLLRKIGISDAEFTNDASGGRVHMYAGGDGMVDRQGATRLMSGAVFADAYKTLFANDAKLAAYDVLLLQCEGAQIESSKKPYVNNLKRYADNGGRIFAEHLHSVFFRLGPPPWPATGKWLGGGTADLVPPVTGLIETSFPKGMALASWLMAVGASPTAGQIPLDMAQHSVDEPLGFGTQRWIYTMTPLPSVQYLTFNTPVEVPPEQQCGRAVFTDVHVGTGGGVSHPETPFPSGCSTLTTLSPQEKALEFMLFDLSSCVLPDMMKPVPPVIE
ncbi:MAG: carboxypeptidase-like regulatory domain-containing protein [Pseudomonadota bacterium]